MAERSHDGQSPANPRAASSDSQPQTNVRPLRLHADPDPLGDLPAGDEFAELDRLYRQALDAVDAVEQELNSAADALYGREPDDVESVTAGEYSEPRGGASAARAGNSVAPLPAPAEGGRSGDAGTPDSPPAEGAAAKPPIPSEVAASSRSETDESSVIAPDAPRHRATIVQVLEAALFVGGTPLTTKKLCALFRGEFDQNFIEASIDALNARYAIERRPYEIRFGEGGYRMVLNETFDDVRSRVFGHGPREVTLSQEALEVLSLVAYRQPIAKEEIESVGREGTAQILRQLLRRELVCLKRDNKHPKRVSYHTTRRFLDVFGLADLSGLPQADELNFK